MNLNNNTTQFIPFYFACLPYLQAHCLPGQEGAPRPSLVHPWTHREPFHTIRRPSVYRAWGCRGQRPFGPSSLRSGRSWRGPRRWCELQPRRGRFSRRRVTRPRDGSWRRWFYRYGCPAGMEQLLPQPGQIYKEHAIKCNSFPCIKNLYKLWSNFFK